MENTQLKSKELKKDKETSKNKSKEPKKVKEPSKKPKKTKETEYKLSDETLELIKKYKVDKVFINHSKIIDDNILTSLILHHKVLNYKCYNSKCKVGSEWCGNPINLIIERINNKPNDLRIKNLRFVCYNCYFVNNSNDYKKLFVKMKEKNILECKICGYNISNLPYNYQNMKICKICIKKNTSTNNYLKRDNLFLNTFENTLTEDDLIEKDTFCDYDDIEDYGDSEDENDDTININFSIKKARSTRSTNKKYKTKGSSSQLIDIKMNDLNMEDIKLLSDMVK